MSTRELETGLTSLRFSRHMTIKLLEAIPDSWWFHIPIDNGNHAAWIAGHLAWEDDDCLNALVPDRGTKLPQSWHDAFGTGSKPIPNESDYPPLSKLRAPLNEFRDELNAFFTSHADRLDAPIPKELHGFAPDLASLMNAIACHEMIHVGQLTVIRKSLKLAPVFA